MAGPMAGRVALVTGASRGIGEATAREFASRGASVALLARSREALEAVASSIRETGGTALPVATDVTNEASVNEAVETVMRKFGRLDHAVNNAGLVYRRPFLDLAAEDWDAMMGVNLRGIFFCMQNEIRAMLATGGGSIVNISSVGGHRAAPLLAPYVSAKHGLHGLTSSVALEFARLNIRANIFAPGRVETEMLLEAAPDPALRAAYGERTPMGRMARPCEMAKPIVWLASDESSYLTGAMVAGDGGVTLGHS